MTKTDDPGFIKGRLKSFRFAFKGFLYLVRHEHSIMVQMSIAGAVCLLGWYLEISSYEWLAQILAIGLVLVAEGLNTAIEKLCDFVHKDYHKDIGLIKDIAAGSVTFAALTAVIVGFIIYLPRLIEAVGF